MGRMFFRSQPVWLALGLVVGLTLGGLWPHSPLHAVATDRYETFAIATGPVETDIEALYFLDFLTGDLRAAVLNQQTGTFMSFFTYNIMADLGVKEDSNPRYLMVTGMADLRRGAARMRPSLAVVYVAEITSGKVAAYAIPWAPEARAIGRVVKMPLVRLDVTQFRPVAIRPQGQGQPQP